jgi:serine protease Do
VQHGERHGRLRPAQQTLRSVYTVESGESLGTAWLAWKRGGQSYLITANHVVADAMSTGDTSVTLRQHSRSYPGTVIKTDETNDLALIRTDAALGPALWQRPHLDVTPVAGDQLILVGSPYGLEGTVTEGVVSRVTYDAIQTDAAANPGNSGGPAVDKDGEVVGVLLAGGGENLNFAVPIQRACVTLRPC